MTFETVERYLYAATKDLPKKAAPTSSGSCGPTLPTCWTPAARAERWRRVTSAPF